MHIKNVGTLRGPRQIGTPYHGVVRNGSLTLPNSEQLIYPQPAAITGSSGVARAGSNRYVKSPFAATEIYPTPEALQYDLARGVEWKNYNLLAGRDMAIGGHALGQDHWIYIDGAGNRWVIQVEVTMEPKPPGIVVFIAEYLNIKVTLKSRFGHFRFDRGMETSIDRELQNLDMDTVPTGNPNLEPASDKYNFFLTLGKGLLIEPNPDGSSVLLHWYYDNHNNFQQPNGPWFIYDNHNLIAPAYWGRPIVLGYVFKIELAGDGLIPSSPEQGDLGNNITASISNYINGDTTEGTLTTCKHPVYGNYLYRIVHDSIGNEIAFTFNSGAVYRNGIFQFQANTDSEFGYNQIASSIILASNNIVGWLKKMGNGLSTNSCEKARFAEFVGPEGDVDAVNIYRDHALFQDWYRDMQFTFDWDNQAVIAEESADRACYV